MKLLSTCVSIIYLLLSFTISFNLHKFQPSVCRTSTHRHSSASTVTKEYGAQSITVLEGLEPVRKRPGMYIGSTGTRGLHHLVFEVVDNSVDESLAGYCTEIMVTLTTDGSVEVTDNGRGIPCAVHPTTGKSTLETVLCVLHAGGKFGGEESGYKVSGGLHGVGISVVNALSEKLIVEVNREGKSHTMQFADGIPQTSLIVQPLVDPTLRGTKVLFKPDPKIFKTTLDFEFEKLASRLDELAYLNPGLTIRLIDRRTKAARKQHAVQAMIQEEYDNPTIQPLLSRLPSKSIKGSKKTISPKTGKVINSLSESEYDLHNGPLSEFKGLSTASSTATDGEDIQPRVEVYRHEGGIVEMVKTMCSDKTNLHPELETLVIEVAADSKNAVAVSAALRWSSDLYTDSLVGFANNIRTSDGGSHLDGLKSAVTRTVNALARKSGKLKEGMSNIPGEFIREGLTAVISVKVPEPEFEGQTKTRLGNPEIRQLVDSAASDALTTLFEWHPTVLASIVGKAMDAQSAALAAKAARDMVRRKTLLSSTVLPGKLADCSSRLPTECEIYVVEGDSAAGSAKQGRDRRTQAILPLRGKILNIERASNEKIYQNTELQALISALGLGIRGIEFDAEQLRYHKVIIMTDADVDGAHIRLLLLTFLYRYQRDLVDRGHVYVACPPLYKVTTKGRGGGDNYLYDQVAFDEYMKTLPSDASPQIQRFKGLGEMMPTQLWNTTMDPAKRILKLVSVEDASAADKLFSVLMGDNVVPRKEFITANAENMRLEDLDF